MNTAISFWIGSGIILNTESIAIENGIQNTKMDSTHYGHEIRRKQQSSKESQCIAFGVTDQLCGSMKIVGKRKTHTDKAQKEHNENT